MEDQLLALVVRKERLDLALLSEDLVKQQNDFTIKMKELEDNILYKLATAQGDITEDVELIEGLENTKKIATEIGIKQTQATETQVYFYFTIIITITHFTIIIITRLPSKLLVRSIEV